MASMIRKTFEQYLAQGATLHAARAAYDIHGKVAERALATFVEWCGGIEAYKANVPHVVLPTVYRLAYKLALGKTVEEALAKEYLYRWNLAMQSTVAFGAPHALGM